MSAVLDVIALHGGYTEVDILKGVDLTLKAGQIVTVAGTNGAGKSTLAKAIVGLLPNVQGEILVVGRSILDQPAEKRAGLGIGYVPQVANVFGGLSVLDNLRVVANVQGRRQRVEAMFERFPMLAERRRAYASSLSGGERRQLAFARALMAEPKIMVLDEPTAALSPVKVAESFQLIRTLPGFGGLRADRRAARAPGPGDLRLRLHHGWRQGRARRRCRRAAGRRARRGIVSGPGDGQRASRPEPAMLASAR